MVEGFIMCSYGRTKGIGGHLRKQEVVDKVKGLDFSNRVVVSIYRDQEL